MWSLRSHGLYVKNFYHITKCVRIRSCSTSCSTNGLGDIYERYIQEKPDIHDQIIVAMSSGVDSSVCAAMFAKEYPNVKGIYMANWSQTAKCTESDWNDVKTVCESINIPCERVSFEKEYWTDVFEPMIASYEQGATPNPDLLCNRYVKFGSLFNHIQKKMGDKRWWLVTGHYARIMRLKDTNEYHLLRAHYKQKDQSYYLSTIEKDILPRILMPIGHLEKPTVRKIASELGLPTASKPDSQGLCFVSQEENHFKHFLDEYIVPKPGNIITNDGKIWGRHQGLWHGTIGQKSGISMPQGDPKYKGTWFISEKRYDTNELVITKGTKNEALYANKIEASGWRWLVDIDIIRRCASEGTLEIQYRSLQAPAKVKEFEYKGGVAYVELYDMARAMAPGQALVMYSNERVLGSGIIDKTCK